MAAGLEFDKDSPEYIATASLDALAAGTEDVYPGEMSSSFEQALRQDPKQLERDVTEMARQVLNAAAAN